MRVPCRTVYIGDPKRDPNVENYPLGIAWDLVIGLYVFMLIGYLAAYLEHFIMLMTIGSPVAP